MQVRQYQKVIQKWLGRGIVGVGQKRGLFTYGEILVLVYNAPENNVVSVQCLRGFTIFARFVELAEYTGLSLEELRLQTVKAGRRSTLNQAVNAVEAYLKEHPVKTRKTKPKLLLGEDQKDLFETNSAANTYYRLNSTAMTAKIPKTP